MERDFLGLLTVKEENVVNEEKIDITVDSGIVLSFFFPLYRSVRLGMYCSDFKLL